MRLGDDTFWQLRVGITLYESPGVFPMERVVLPFQIKGTSDGFVVGISPKGRAFTINPAVGGAFDEFFAHVSAEIKNAYETGLDRFLQGNERGIGFRPEHR